MRLKTEVLGPTKSDVRLFGMRVRSLAVGIVLVMAGSAVALADDAPVTVEADPKVNLPSRVELAHAATGREEITVVFTGDTLIHSSVANAARTRGGYDFRPMFSGVKHLISQADLAICHLEVPLSPTNSNLSSYPLFNAPREVADALVWAGYDGCSTASNHSIDRGVSGIGGTIEVLNAAGLTHSGMAAEPINGWEAAMYELEDVTVANVSATYWLNGRVMPRDQQYLVQLLDVDQIITAAAAARGDGADLVVVSMHCCTEYRHQPTAVQKEISRTRSSNPSSSTLSSPTTHTSWAPSRR